MGNENAKPKKKPINLNYPQPTLPVPLPLPWRDLGSDPWSVKTKNELKNEIVTYELLKDAGIDFCNILLVGEVSAGKSSLFNTVESVFDGHVCARAMVGYSGSLASGTSQTTTFRKYQVEAKDFKNRPIKFQFCDTMGLQGNLVDTPTVSDIVDIMRGHVNDRAALIGGVKEASANFNKAPEFKDKIHCIAFVIKAPTFSTMDPSVIAQIEQVKNEAVRRDLNPIFILTAVDEICSSTEKDIVNVFHSKAVFEKVQEVARKFGVNENRVYPVQSYTSETETTLGIDTLMLRVLRQAVRTCESFLKDTAF